MTRKCLGAECANDATSLQCPTCQKVGRDSFFCSQDCFKKNWVDIRLCLCPLQVHGQLSDSHLFAQSKHKLIHQSQSNLLRKVLPPRIVSYVDEDTGQYNPFPTYNYTGSLRPVYPLSPRRAVPERIVNPDYAKDGVPRSEQVFVSRNKITILDKKQQDAMRKVCRMAREVLDIAAREIKPGITTEHIDEVVHKACLERDV